MDKALDAKAYFGKTVPFPAYMNTYSGKLEKCSMSTASVTQIGIVSMVYVQSITQRETRILRDIFFVEPGKTYRWHNGDDMVTFGRDFFICYTVVINII